MLDSWDLYFKNFSPVINSSETRTNISSCWVNAIAVIETNEQAANASTVSDATLRKIHVTVLLTTSIFCTVLVALLILCSCFSNETFVNVVLRRRIKLPKKGIEGQFQFLMPLQSKDTYSSAAKSLSGNHVAPDPSHVARDFGHVSRGKIDVIVEVDCESSFTEPQDCDVMDFSPTTRTITSDDVTSITSPFSDYEVNDGDECSAKSLSSLLERIEPKCSFENFYMCEETER